MIETQEVLLTESPKILNTYMCNPCSETKAHNDSLYIMS